MYSFLSANWSGLIIAAAILLIGWALFRQTRILRYVGMGILVVGGLLALGASYHVVRTVTAKIKYPPPGKMVDVGGFDMHIWAEGDGKGKPTIIWVPGGHSGGAAFYNMHKIFREEARSILYDRASSGWSDTGPFPRTTLRDVEELHRALAAAGEDGPFVLVGHSYGGLLAVNYALRHPENVAGLVLLDATHPYYGMYSVVDIVSPIVMINEIMGIANLFGINLFNVFYSAEGVKEVMQQMEEELSDVYEEFGATELLPRSQFAMASIIQEDFQLYRFFPNIVFDGELGDLPVTVMIQDGPSWEEIERTMPEAFDGAWQSFHNATGLDRTEFDRYNAFSSQIPRTYLGLSSETQLALAPKGATHNFPYETPEAVVQTVREILDRIADKVK